MEMLRRNLFWIICGAVALTGIGLGVTALRAMPNVLREMENATGVYKSLDTLQSAPVNQRAIDAQRERITAIKEDYDQVLDRAKQLYNYEPLLPEVFPEGLPLKRIEFRTRYQAAMEELYGKLGCGSLPSQGDIAAMKDRRANEIASGMPAQLTDPRSPAGVLTAAGLRDDPTARAAIANALGFSCYCVAVKDEKPPDFHGTFQFNEAMKQTDSVVAPELFDVWMAQIGYWIQKDVVDAIVAVNEAAAQEARAAGLNPWVGTMAVKDVISIRLSTLGYVPPEGDLVVVAKPGDYTPGLPPGTGESVFTGTKSNQQYDVIQFTVKLVMDQRDIPRLVEKLSNNRFHTLVRAAYVAVLPNRELKGKIYGAEPAVNVVFDFETVMLGEVFRSMMPASVCEFFQIPCPPPQ